MVTFTLLCSFVYPVFIRTFPLLLLLSISLPVQPLHADPLYFLAVNQSFQAHILEIIKCEPIESIQDPLPFLFVYVFETFQLAPTIWTCFPGRDRSCFPISGSFAAVKGLLSGIYFPPIVVKKLKRLEETGNKL